MASSFAVDTNLKKVLKVRYNSGKLPTCICADSPCWR